MRCEGLLLSLTLVTPIRLTGSRQDCSEEFSRERQLYPHCVPGTCGRLARDISQVSVITIN